MERCQLFQRNTPSNRRLVFIDYSWYLVNVKSCSSFDMDCSFFFEIFFAIFVLIEKRLYLCHIKIILYKFWEHFFIIYWTMVAREYLVISHSNCFSFSLSCLFLHSIPVCKESLQANWFLISKVFQMKCRRPMPWPEVHPLFLLKNRLIILLKNWMMTSTQ